MFDRVAVIEPISRLSLSPMIYTAISGAAAWSSANLAVYVPFRLTGPNVATKLFIGNGNPVAGNVDIGIYDHAGRKIVSTGSVARSGVNDHQVIDIADTMLDAGLFYLAVAMDTTTNSNYRRYTVTAAYHTKMMGVAQQASAFPLPATATFATATVTDIAVAGVLFNRSVL